MLEILQYDFIQNALISGILISIAAGIIGSLVVVNKITFLTGGITQLLWRNWTCYLSRNSSFIWSYYFLQ